MYRAPAVEKCGFAQAAPWWRLSDLHLYGVILDIDCRNVLCNSDLPANIILHNVITIERCWTYHTPHICCIWVRLSSLILFYCSDSKVSAFFATEKAVVSCSIMTRLQRQAPWCYKTMPFCLNMDPEFIRLFIRNKMNDTSNLWKAHNKHFAHYIQFSLYWQNKLQFTS